MLCYDGIDKNQGIDPTKSNKSREWMICHHWFFNHGFKSKYSVCNGSHDLSMLYLNISDIVIITVKNVDYRCIMYNISKSEAINLSENSVLEDGGYIYKKNMVLIFSLFKTDFFFNFFCLLYIKWLILWTSISL